MRHRKFGLKLSRTSSHRDAMFRNMVTSLLKHQRIQTTDTKAKELRRWADHLITLAKRGDLHARRQAMAIVREKAVVHKLFEEAPGRYGPVSGGYTRIVKLGRRPGDAAPVSLVELVEPAAPTKKKKVKGKPKAPAAPKKAAVKGAAPGTAPVSEAEEAAEATDVDDAPAESAVAAAEDRDDVPADTAAAPVATVDETGEVEAKTDEPPEAPAAEDKPEK
jgi:large subunit ribosomal protein L17